MLYVTDPETQLHKKGGQFLVCRGQDVLTHIPLEKLDGVVLFGGVQASSQAMITLLQRGISTLWLSQKGGYYGRLEPAKQQEKAACQRRQFRLSEQSAWRLSLATHLVEAKIRNALTLIRRYKRKFPELSLDGQIEEMERLVQLVLKTSNVEMLLGTEGNAARIYFQALNKIVPPAFVFAGRTRRPPKDPVNSLLSFGYFLVAQELHALLAQCGLQPYVGFLHCDRKGHPTLASDLLEEWRAVLVDSLVLSLLWKNVIREEHFANPDEHGGVYLHPEGRRIFLKAYEAKMNQESSYSGANISYRQALRRQVNFLYRAIETGNVADYHPFLIR